MRRLSEQASNTAASPIALLSAYSCGTERGCGLQDELCLNRILSAMKIRYAKPSRGRLRTKYSRGVSIHLQKLLRD